MLFLLSDSIYVVRGYLLGPAEKRGYCITQAGSEKVGGGGRGKTREAESLDQVPGRCCRGAWCAHPSPWRWGDEMGKR